MSRSPCRGQKTKIWSKNFKLKRLISSQRWETLLSFSHQRGYPANRSFSETLKAQPRSQGSLLPALSLLRADRREPWERGCYNSCNWGTSAHSRVKRGLLMASAELTNSYNSCLVQFTIFLENVFILSYSVRGIPRKRKKKPRMLSMWNLFSSGKIPYSLNFIFFWELVHIFRLCALYIIPTDASNLLRFVKVVFGVLKFLNR